MIKMAIVSEKYAYNSAYLSIVKIEETRRGHHMYGCFKYTTVPYVYDNYDTLIMYFDEDELILLERRQCAPQ